MKHMIESGLRHGVKGSWSVAVIHEDSTTRDWAVSFCDQLVGRFWEQYEFSIDWWSFDLLKDPAAAREALANAAVAELIVVAAVPEGDFPLHTKGWLDSWLRQRGQREGVLVGLAGPPESPPLVEGARQAFLRQAAHRAAMDYLTHVPADLCRSIPDSLDSYSTRAEAVTGLLDDILRRPVPPPKTL